MGDDPSDAYRYKQPLRKEEKELELERDPSAGMSLVSIASESDLWRSTGSGFGKAAVHTGLVLAVGGSDSKEAREIFVDERSQGEKDFLNTF